MNAKSKDQIKLSDQQLKDVKKRLLKKREELKEELKTKHREVYEWLVKNNIDLNNLQNYSKNIVAAIALSAQVAITNPILAPVPTPPPKTDEDTDAKDPNTDNNEKAKQVWEKYGDIINKVSEKYDIDPQLIFATIMTESEGNPYSYRYEAHINDASYGLGQILYGTAVRLGYQGTPDEMYRPEISVDLIGKYHKNTVETYGSLTPEQMTVVYNTGGLFRYAYPGHLNRFQEWYYNYPDNRVKLV